MQYAMLVYFHEREFQALPAEEQNNLRNLCADWHEALLRSGHSRGAMRLQPTSTATTLRMENQRVALVDGPFAETKEILGGLVTLECRDLDEALALARSFPSLTAAAGFAVELRPIMPDGVRRTDAT